MGRFDDYSAGILFGSLGPALGAFIFYLLIYAHAMSPGEFYNQMVDSGTADEILSVGAILNLALFFLFLRLKADKTSKGIIIATFMYVILIIFLKIF